MFVSGLCGLASLPFDSQWSRYLQYVYVSVCRSHTFSRCCMFPKSLLVTFPIFLLQFSSHGSVATQLKCGGIFNNYFIANCLQYVLLKYFLNRSIFGEDMKNNKEGRFLRHSVVQNLLYHFAIKKACFSVYLRFICLRHGSDGSFENIDSKLSCFFGLMFLNRYVLYIDDAQWSICVQID